MRNPSTKSITLAVTLAATLVASVPVTSYAGTRRAQTPTTQSSRDSERISPLDRLKTMLWRVIELMEPTTTWPKQNEEPSDPPPPHVTPEMEPTTTVPVPPA